MEQSPSFSKYSDEVLCDVVLQGAAKLAGFVSLSSVVKLSELRHSDTSLWSLERACHELSPIIAALYSEQNQAEGMRVRTGRVFCTADGEATKPHQDDSYPRGISLLIPTDGPAGLFAAHDERFAFREQGSCDLPSPRLSWEYGKGDIILLRQKLKNINGKGAGLGAFDQMWHAGHSDKPRTLRTIDFDTRAIHVPSLSKKDISRSRNRK